MILKASVASGASSMRLTLDDLLELADRVTWTAPTSIGEGR